MNLTLWTNNPRFSSLLTSSCNGVGQKYLSGSLLCLLHIWTFCKEWAKTNIWQQGFVLDMIVFISLRRCHSCQPVFVPSSGLQCDLRVCSGCHNFFLMEEVLTSMFFVVRLYVQHMSNRIQSRSYFLWHPVLTDYVSTIGGYCPCLWIGTVLGSYQICHFICFDFCIQGEFGMLGIGRDLSSLGFFASASLSCICEIGPCC